MICYAQVQHFHFLGWNLKLKQHHPTYALEEAIAIVLNVAYSQEGYIGLQHLMQFS